MHRDLDDYAMRAKLMTSPLKLGDWLTETFGSDIVGQRRARERATAALERGAPVVLRAVVPSASLPRAAAAAGSAPRSLPPVRRKRSVMAVVTFTLVLFMAIAAVIKTLAAH